MIPPPSLPVVEVLVSVEVAVLVASVLVPVLVAVVVASVEVAIVVVASVVVPVLVAVVVACVAVSAAAAGGEVVSVTTSTGVIAGLDVPPDNCSSGWGVILSSSAVCASAKVPLRLPIKRIAKSDLIILFIMF